MLHGFHPDIVHESDLELHEILDEGQRTKQLGADPYPAFTYRGTAALREPAKRVWGYEWPNIVSGNFMANPSAVFRAMADGDPYPVKAFFTLGNNTLLSYANMQLIEKGLKNQDLVVAVEHFRTPTAQLADFILPGDAWLERSCLSDGFGWTAIYRPSQKTVEPPGECRTVYDFWRELAVRMQLGDEFPWKSNEEVLDYRVSRLGMTFAEFAAQHPVHMPKMSYRKYEGTGFATPSGKVELESSVLKDLGFDPLPYWREDPPRTDDFPLTLFMGIREDEYFQTGHRHIAALRKRNPTPNVFITAEDAQACSVVEGQWVRVSTQQGSVALKVEIRADMPKGVIRVPHGWWLPERSEGDGTLSGAWLHADAQICPDDSDNLDREQGIPHLKGLPCRVMPLEEFVEADNVARPAR